MPSKVKHMAIISDNAVGIGKFYSTLFGMDMTMAPTGRVAYVSDGSSKSIGPRRRRRTGGNAHDGAQFLAGVHAYGLTL